MKNLYNIKLFMLGCLVVCLGFLTSCDDDDETTPNTGQVELLSFGPTGVQHGEEIRFIGRNLSKVEAIELAGVTVAKASFLEHTSELIRLIVPQEAMEGRVTLKLAGGEQVLSKTMLSFEVPITITAVTPEAKPGTNITITGTKLNWIEGVVFESDTVKEFVSQTASELVLPVPITAKTGKLVLIGGGTEPSFVETEQDLIVTLPAVTAIAPATVFAGENLTITGTNLDLVKEIKFTGVGAANVTSFVSQSETGIVVKVPANASKGTIKLVAHSDEEVTTTQEVVLHLPAVTALTPAAVKHGENLTITGTNLNLVKEVKFAGVGAANVTSFVSKTATQLVLKVPDNASKGALKLVANTGVEVATTLELTIVLPAITSVSPSPVDPGQNLIINGTDLDLVKSIEFKGGAKATTFISKTPTRIEVQVPMTAQRGAITLLTVKDYVVETQAQVTIVLPVITAVTPEPVIAGNYLTLSGTELHLVKLVVFTGGATVSTFVAQNATQIVLTVPAAAQTGVLKLITHSNFEVTSDQQAQIGTAAPNIAYYIFNDELRSAENDAWQKWGGWGTTNQDLENTEQVSRGTKSIKVEYNDAYGALQLHPTNPQALAGYTHLVLYVYGGSGNNRMAIQLKTTAGGFSAEPTFTLKEGEWQKVEIEIKAFGDISGGIAEFMVKNYGTNPNTVYIDDVGLR
ncbi:IPT/TIG domain-containing protein [Pontibacter beigongshangensis]|uniref:IPT/TIG domain-containing protein n=1 Tax=Pontibacter beigongshangensis TaxID=2574733 RepID=UPI0016505BFD|nr:IPT/TIG domain-containing protein [Pontibacter beigongshangensis]